MADYILLLVPLISAYIIVDFFSQLDWLVNRIIISAIINGCFAYILCAQWSIWYVPVFIAFLHLIVKVIQKKLNSTWPIFLLFHALHFIFIVMIVFIILPIVKPFNYLILPVIYLKIITIISGFVFTVYMSGNFIEKIVSPIAPKSDPSLSGLQDGGKMIGQLERTLILMLILFNMPAGIGFLVAAKSILRFGEASKYKTFAEYALIGTFWSYGIAIFFGMSIKFIISNFI